MNLFAFGNSTENCWAALCCVANDRINSGWVTCSVRSVRSAKTEKERSLAAAIQKKKEEEERAPRYSPFFIIIIRLCVYNTIDEKEEEEEEETLAATNRRAHPWLATNNQQDGPVSFPLRADSKAIDFASLCVCVSIYVISYLLGTTPAAINIRR